MTSPIRSNHDEQERLRLQQFLKSSTERPLGWKEYRYRQPEREDYKASVIKCLVYGPIILLSIFMLKGEFYLPAYGIFTGLLSYSAVMVLDALLGASQASLKGPSHCDYLFPVQSAEFGFKGIIFLLGAGYGVISILLGFVEIFSDLSSRIFG